MEGPAATTTLYRPVGQAELDLIAATGYRPFPPRLPEQPIFYPVATRSMRCRSRASGTRRAAASGT